MKSMVITIKSDDSENFIILPVLINNSWFVSVPCFDVTGGIFPPTLFSSTNQPSQT
ncbi:MULTISPECIES: hypothetical protein [Bacillaceae]|uniref:hypothetical protein n=1 Tax=Bacillaceae TaxID=186817 RepID=UPI0015970BEE|nr:hypothetical protein [Bacillus sp. AFS096315]